jgi:hypothetical protein
VLYEMNVRELHQSVDFGNSQRRDTAAAPGLAKYRNVILDHFGLGVHRFGRLVNDSVDEVYLNCRNRHTGIV